ncbi:hypothetical protein G9A89_005481 [Geosiphon pyriformis]|nr:hypothetical protein G9A89_005481 [Geosiphon pyriformis]
MAKEEEPISSCTLKSELQSNSDLNSNNNDNKNNSSSSIQYGNNNNNSSNSNLNPEQYIVFSDLTKEQELKWFSDNNKSIMPECVHNTDAEFDLKYPGKEAIRLELYLHICIDLKVALEIPATTMVQLASRNSLVEKKIYIRKRIIDTEYIRNIIAMLQNDLKKTYIIEPNEKIAQTIFLPLVKIVQLVLAENREKLGITAKGIKEFRFMERIDVLVNIAEEEIIDKKKIIFICQPISISPYSQYILIIERKIKNQA